MEDKVKKRKSFAEKTLTERAQTKRALWDF